MKRNIFAALIVLLVLFITSCSPETPEPPYGVWVSNEPQITLFFKPQYRLPIYRPIYLGLYTIDGVETKVVLSFGHGTRFTVQALDALFEGGTRGDYRLLVGTYRLMGGEIRYTLTPVFQERLGIDRIWFRRMEYYDPIDPYYWSSHFFPRMEGSTP